MLVLERNPRRRRIAKLVLGQLHEHFPERVPLHVVKGAFTWAEPIEHDGYHVTGQTLFDYIGPDSDIIVHIEAGCPGHSQLGLKNGFNHSESGALVPVAEALVDLQFTDGAATGSGLAAFNVEGVRIRVSGGAQDGVGKCSLGGEVQVLKALTDSGEWVGGHVGKSFAYGA